ncbi:hypothetical protein HMPREF3226_01791 [Prevotella corporis]|uniref:Uncharacterized protein n=1 Tax=Prevotella corporis TaxID=28128 RepID=A0A133Q2R8_9BACT|nr:hypothetical protein HMPREF3226_01791 [Prevotella corporis]
MTFDTVKAHLLQYVFACDKNARKLMPSILNSGMGSKDNLS